MLLFKVGQPQTVTVVFASEGIAVTGLTASDIEAHISENGGAPQLFDLTGQITELGVDMPGLYSIDIPGTEIDQTGEFVLNLKDPSGSIFDTYVVKAQVFNSLFDDFGTVLTTIDNNVDTALVDLTDIKGAGFATGSDSLAVLSGDLSSVSSTVNGNSADLSDIKGAGFDTATDSLEAQRDIFDTRVPAEVALKSNLVGTGGTENAPTGVGLWDVLGDGTVTLPDIDTAASRILGLSHENFAILNQNYDVENNLLGATVRIYPSKTDTENDTNHVEEYTVTAEYDTANRLTSYKMVREP